MTIIYCLKLPLLFFMNNLFAFIYLFNSNLFILPLFIYFTKVFILKGVHMLFISHLSLNLLNFNLVPEIVRSNIRIYIRR